MAQEAQLDFGRALGGDTHMMFVFDLFDTHSLPLSKIYVLNNFKTGIFFDPHSPLSMVVICVCPSDQWIFPIACAYLPT